jgi:hypothetical protein
MHLLNPLLAAMFLGSRNIESLVSEQPSEQITNKKSRVGRKTETPDAAEGDVRSYSDETITPLTDLNLTALNVFWLSLKRQDAPDTYVNKDRRSILKFQPLALLVKGHAC